MKRKIRTTKLVGSTKRSIFKTCLTLHKLKEKEVIPERIENPLGFNSPREALIAITKVSK
jgi:hypothetical protein